MSKLSLKAKEPSDRARIKAPTRRVVLKHNGWLACAWNGGAALALRPSTFSSLVVAALISGASRWARSFKLPPCNEEAVKREVAHLLK